VNLIDIGFLSFIKDFTGWLIPKGREVKYTVCSAISLFLGWFMGGWILIDWRFDEI
jgi:hypothetical protein